MAHSTTRKSSTKKSTKAQSKIMRSPKKKAQPEKILKKVNQSKSPSQQKNYGKAELLLFRNIILEKQKEIYEELELLRNTMMDSTTHEYTNENPTYSTHMEQGTDSMEREKIFMFASREGKFLNYLEDALKRIDSGNYGHCNTCGKLISKERLEAVPHASQCLDCKENRTK